MAPVIKAQKAGTIKKLKSSLKRGGQNSFIKNVPKDGSLTVRFLEEPNEWIEYKEYYSEDTEPRFFPDFEGIDPDVIADLKKPSKKFLASAVDRDTSEVIAIKMPTTLVDSLMKKYDKYETILDRDYELVRDGEGMDTTYEAIPEAPKRMNTAKYTPMDLWDVLAKQIPAEFSGDADDDDDNLAADDDKPITRKRRSRPVSSGTSSKTATKRPIKKRRSTASGASTATKKKRPLRRR